VKKAGPVAIIGAGISGLSCAQVLLAAGVDVRIYESGPGVGGRCATRLWQGHLVDFGVQYFTAQSAEFKRELLTRLRQFRPIISPVIDAAGAVVPSPGGPRFYVLQGNNYLAHVLSRGLDLRLNTRVDSVSFLASGINCLGETYGAVVSSLPAPLTARVFGLGAASTDYEPCITALLEYSGTHVGTTRDAYARVRAANGHHVVGSYCENHKVGRIIGNKTVFIAQASANFSREYEGVPADTYLPLLARENEQLWRIPAGLLSAGSGHRWVFGHPHADHRRRVELPPGTFFCGDSRTESTVESVWLDGRNAAQDVLNYLAALS
jgi:predicted NAD/FAD-dependent oxidoreductase